MCVCVYTHTHTHTYIYTYLGTYICIYIYYIYIQFGMYLVSLHHFSFLTYIKNWSTHPAVLTLYCETTCSFKHRKEWKHNDTCQSCACVCHWFQSCCNYMRKAFHKVILLHVGRLALSDGCGMGLSKTNGTKWNRQIAVSLNCKKIRSLDSREALPRRVSGSVPKSSEQPRRLHRQLPKWTEC